MTARDRLELDHVVFIGRTYAEYVRMFGLAESDLMKGAILDCAAGPSSFTAEARGRGMKATACDVLYGAPAAYLADKGRRDIVHTFRKVDDVPHLYVWKHYLDRDEIVSLRHRALARFTEDYPSGTVEGRYVRAELPRLPFPDRVFDLVLSSHFLFLYGDMVSVDLHVSSLLEMARVSSGEVRVYPLQGLDARPYRHMGAVLEAVRAEGLRAEIMPTAFEFQRGANRKLVLHR